jgi:TolB-like protein
MMELALLGGFQARRGEKVIEVPGRKERALLAFLAMPPGAKRSRERLCGLLWGDRGDKQARDSLKQALHRLRRSFDPTFALPVLADRESLTLEREATSVDVQAFERFVELGTPDALARATTLYRGDLLDGLEVRDAAFEAWLLIERQRLRGMAREALATLLDWHVARDSRQQADAIAHQLLALDPLRETAHRALMRSYAEQGQAALALKQYQLCRDALRDELGVGPEDETELLYKSIRAGRAAKASPPVTPPHSDQASIAVLPFVNMSGDKGREYFADGITEDIITDLSRWRSMRVSSRNSTFRFKGRPLDVQSIGRELGARFLVEGSVRQIGDRIRITAQLTDSENGHHLWAERYDRPAGDLFTVQDSVVRSIVGTLMGRVRVSESERIGRKPPSSLAAYDLALRGNALSWDDPASAAEAKRVFERAIEIDPGYALPHSLLAYVLTREWDNDLSGRVTLDPALALAMRAVELADNESTCHTVLGHIHQRRGSFDLARHHVERGVEINPANPWIQGDYGYLLAYIGRAEEALEILRAARRADPYFGPPWYWRGLGIAQFVLRRYADALADFDRGATNSPRFVLALMAGCCAKLGRTERARELKALCLAGQPDSAIRKAAAKIPFSRATDREHLVECLRLAETAER